MGGTGKTPAVVFLAKEFAKIKRYRVGVVSRGYKGLASHKGAVVSDGKNIYQNCREAGDEPFLMAIHLSGIPIAVGKNRYKMAVKLVENYGVNLLILDDGFQHYKIARDVDIVLLNAKDPFCKEHGFLRESPFSLRRADIIILTNAQLLTPEKISTLRDILQKMSGHDKIFFSQHKPYSLKAIKAMSSQARLKTHHGKEIKLKSSMIRFLRNKKIYAVSGIGDPESFEDTLYRFGVEGITHLRYSDHHIYSQKDINSILELPDKSVVITTEKDAVKLLHDPGICQKENLYVLKISLAFENNYGQRNAQRKIIQYVASLLEDDI